MNRNEFCQLHWNYYMMLEKDFRKLERYVSFDFGDNYLYGKRTVTDFGNSLTYSNEFIKQFQAICSEVDVLLKSICNELFNVKASNISEYSNLVLNKWNYISEQKVEMKSVLLQPFVNWILIPDHRKGSNNYQSPDWWNAYNHVKHKRLNCYKEANLKNVSNALAGLFILESYFVREIGQRDDTYDVPNDFSNIFKMSNFKTRSIVIGYESYVISNEDIDKLMNSDDQANFLNVVSNF